MRAGEAKDVAWDDAGDGINGEIMELNRRALVSVQI